MPTAIPAARTADQRRYRVYGLRVLSDLPLPELHTDEVGESPDVEIRIGSIPDLEADEYLSFGPDGAVLRVAGVASFCIRQGREIIVEPHLEAADRNVRLFLLGSAMGVLLHQRGLLPLHANAVEIEGKAITFIGESGAGKSTLAAWFHDAGHRIIADDVCVVRIDEKGRSSVQPGLPRIRLWKDALERTNREAHNFELSYAGDETYEKFDVPISSERSSAGELDLAALFVLSVGETFGIRRLTGVDAVDAVFSHTYRGFVGSRLGLDRLHFEAAVKLARNTPIYRFERRRDLAQLTTDVRRLLDQVRDLDKA